MTEPKHPSADLRDLIDAYLSGLIEPDELESLDARLRGDASARRYFVRYARLHTDLFFAARASKAGERALRSIGSIGRARQDARGPIRTAFVRLTETLLESFRKRPFATACLWLLAASALVAVVAAWRGSFWRRDELAKAALTDAALPGDVAWLVNAQDCEWADRLAPAGDMRPGRVLRIERGLAEIGFRSGARVVLEGPASLELVSGTHARLLFGKAAARVPEAAKGFTILSPQGQVVDLGTEFGISVAGDGRTEVFVFEGQVEASPAKRGEPSVPAVRLRENESAVLDADGVSEMSSSPAFEPAHFVRGIVPPVRRAPRSLRLDFREPCDSTLRSADGLGTGLTQRLPGTGTSLAANDENLRLNREAGQLELTTTNTDINRQFQLDQGEYLGLRLADLGFTGAENFAVTVSIPDIPKLELVGQFGLYAGTRSDQVIRGGLISLQTEDRYSLFLVNNSGGVDSDLNLVGLVSTGDDLRLTLRREGGKYSLTVENATTGSSSTLAIRHPGYLDLEQDFAVGVFGANTQSNLSKTIVLRELEVTVWAAEK